MLLCCFVFASPPHPRQRKMFRVAGLAPRGGRSGPQRWQVWPSEVAGLAAKGGRVRPYTWGVHSPFPFTVTTGSFGMKCTYTA